MRSLTVEDLTRCNDDRNLPAVEGVTVLRLRRGEILGVAGVQGNGQTELVEALTGMRDPLQRGQYSSSKGKNMTNASPRKITEKGVGHVPEDRQRDGSRIELYSDAQYGAMHTYYKEAISPIRLW